MKMLTWALQHHVKLVEVNRQLYSIVLFIYLLGKKLYFFVDYNFTSPGFFSSAGVNT